jgi:hypothetical protein
VCCPLHRALKTLSRTRPAGGLTHPWHVRDRSRTYPPHGQPATGSGRPWRPVPGPGGGAVRVAGPGPRVRHCRRWWPMARQYPTCGLTDTARGPGLKGRLALAGWDRPVALPGPSHRGPCPAARSSNLTRAEVRPCPGAGPRFLFGEPALSGHRYPILFPACPMDTQSDSPLRRSLRHAAGPDCIQRVEPRTWRATHHVAEQPGGPAIRPKARVIASRPATCGTVRGLRAHPPGDARRAPAPARSGGRVR